MNEVQRSALASVRSLLDEPGNTVRSYCVCHAKGSSELPFADRQGLGMSAVVCNACGTTRLDPYLTDDALSQFYTNHYQASYQRLVDPEARFSLQAAYGAKAVEAIMDCGRASGLFFEIGCGTGGALPPVMDRGFQAAGCDLDAEMIAFGERKGLDVRLGEFDDVVTDPPDVVFLHHVLEHVQDPASLIRSVVERSAPGVEILVAVPWLSMVTFHRGSGGYLGSFFHIAHKFNFSKRGLQAIARDCGIGVRFIHPPEIATHCSDMPEIWCVFGKNIASQRWVWDVPGRTMGRWLKMTRWLAARHATPPQIMTRLRSRMSRSRRGTGS